MLQLCLSGALKSLGTAAESEPRKLASKLYTLAGFINFTLVFALAVHRLALLTGAMKPSNSRMVKSIMWVTLAVSYFTFIIGTVLNSLA
ncbi:hypothetical protein COCNU_14G001220 [Cocos nucifera]|uniref:Uncharacterized protein n=1 Tax=Cocos nucifera TaxID=13894 RepID=A0A8K0IVI7_COCNU|nr:hypothetical protein COCNU_14G001220 [Cocos nucifera]